MSCGSGAEVAWGHFCKGKPLKYIKRPFSSVVWSYSEDIQARWEWMFLCQTESKSSLAFIILLVIKPVSTTRVGQSSLTTPVCVRFFFFFYCSAHYQSCDLVICAKQSWWDSFPVICLQDMRTKSHHRCSLRNNMFVNSWMFVYVQHCCWYQTHMSRERQLYLSGQGHALLCSNSVQLVA